MDRSAHVRSMATVASMTPSPLPPKAEFQTRSIKIDGKDVSYAVFEGEMEKPLLDQRNYQLIRLANDLEALVISDPETDKASAAMDVRVGHLSDPADLPGMAHFCEHLLFMGTKKYPRENEYSEYLSNHSGSSNAFTSLENTNYFFDVGHSHLEGALDRFAQFFLEPLFDPSCTEREIRAVDSEHKKNLQSDMWRSFQLEKSLCDPSHAYSKFGTGNLATLWEEPRSRGVDIREKLLQFHAKYYSANMMKLVVIGRESVDQLTRWVVEKFSQVPNKACAAPSFPGSPLGIEQQGTEVLFRTIKDVHELDILFPFPEQVHLFRTKPGQLISHFIGHEGHGSLFSCLKQRGWVNELSAGSALHAQGFELFKIHMALTHEGYQHYEDVVAAVFQFLRLLRSKPIETWMYEEVQRLSELRFAFKEKSSPAMYGSTLSNQMQQGLPPSWLLSGPYLLREFDAAQVQSTLECLSLDKCRITLAGRVPPPGVTLDHTETWYGTEYTIRKLRPELLQQCDTLQGLSLPQANSFIPSDLHVLGAPSDLRPTQRPQLLCHDAKARLWHKQDDRFFLPKANVALLLRTPAVNHSPRSAVLSRLFVELVKDALCEYSYDADVAGLHYNLDSQVDGVDIIVGGYNDKLPRLLQSILDSLTQLQVDPKRFEIIKDQVRRNYQNFDLEEPFQHAAYYASYLLTERMWTQHEKLKVIDEVQVADVQAYIPQLCGALFIDMLVHGNMSSTQAHALLSDVQSRLAYAALPPQDTLAPRSLLLAPGTRVSWRIPVANPGNVNSALEYYCQVGDPNDVQLRAKLALFAQIANEPCFDQLRTKEQLGYLVYSGVRMSIGQAGFHVIVQSERDSDYLESRVDAFLEQLLRQVRSMSADEFEAHRRSLIHKRRESVKNLAEETSRFWRSIRSGYFDFLSRERDVAALEQLSQQDIVAFMEHFVCPSSPHRAKTVTHLQAQTPAGALQMLHPEVLPAFFEWVETHGMAVPADLQATLTAQITSTAALTSFVQQMCADGELPPSLSPEALFAEVERLLAAMPSPAQAQEPVVEAPKDVLEAVQVTDVHAFKANLAASAHAQPVLPLDVYERDPHTGLDESLYLPVASTGHRAQL